MSSSELPHMMLLRGPSERRRKRRRRMKLTKAYLRVLAANEWISALKLDKIVLSYLHVLWFQWWHATHHKSTWCTFPGFEKKRKMVANSVLPVHTSNTFPDRQPKKPTTGQESFLTRPSPGLMLVNWTSSKQADWLIRGSEVVLTVWSQMVFKIFDCRRERQTKCHSGQNNKHKTLINSSLWSSSAALNHPKINLLCVLQLRTGG